RYAEIPRQMLAADRWVVPILHGQDYLDKPPLFYWLLMAAYRAFGVSEGTARVVVGIIAVLTVLTMYGWGRRALGPRGALLAAFLVAAPWYVAVARQCPEFGSYFFWFHNVRRYVDPFDHAKPVWFYLPQLFVGMMPWTLLLVPLARLLARRSRRSASRRPGAL